MSYQATAWALTQKTGNPTLKSLLQALAHHAHSKTWACFPSLDELAEETEISKRTVMRRLKELAEAGFIKILPQRRADGKQMNNLYRLAGGQTVTLQPPADGQIDDNRVTLVTTNNEIGLEEKNPPRAKPLGDGLKVEKQKKVSEYGETFDKLWEAWPKERRIGKKNAAIQFAKVTPDQQATMTASAEKWLQEHFKKGKRDERMQYVPHLENWIRKEQYVLYATSESIKRVEPVAPAADDRGKWGVYLSDWRRRDRWPTFLGPEPGFPGSLVPQDMLQHGEQEEADERVLKILNWMPENERRECEAGLRRIPSWLETRSKIFSAASMGQAAGVDSGRLPCGLLPGLSAGGRGGAGEEIHTGK